MSRLDELKKALAELEDRRKGLCAGIDFLKRYGPGRGVNGCTITYSPDGGMIDALFRDSQAKLLKEIAEEEEKARRPTLSRIKHEYEHFGAVNQYTRNYIEALERCRPWAIRIKDTGAIVVDDLGPCVAVPLMFESKEMATMYASRYGIACEIVRWEGEAK